MRTLELDNEHNKEYTDNLTDRIKILKDNIQLKLDTEEAEKTRKYMAKRNLEAETPTKSFHSQVKKAKKKVKLQCLLQERNFTQAEQESNPHQKQYTEIFCQKKSKHKLENFMADFITFNPQTPTKMKY